MTQKKFQLPPGQSVSLNKKKETWLSFRICPQLFIRRKPGLGNIRTYFGHVSHKSEGLFSTGGRNPSHGTAEVPAYGKGMIPSGMQLRALGMQDQVLLGELDMLQKVWKTRGHPWHRTWVCRLHKAAIPAQGLQRDGMQTHKKMGIVSSPVHTVFSSIPLFFKKQQQTKQNTPKKPHTKQAKHNTCTLSAPTTFLIWKEQFGGVQRRKGVKL